MNVPLLLGELVATSLTVDAAPSTFILGGETLCATSRTGMATWRGRLFAPMSRNARRATQFFDLPRERVCEIGAETEL